jgi:hypothetical protein
MEMARYWIVLLLIGLLAGCGETRMARPEDPEGRYRDQIVTARRLLEQEEQWADRAEWEVKKSGDGWEVIAWRIEHPGKTGPERYLPWGYSVIELDSRMVAVHYRRKG